MLKTNNTTVQWEPVWNSVKSPSMSRIVSETKIYAFNDSLVVGFLPINLEACVGAIKEYSMKLWDKKSATVIYWKCSVPHSTFINTAILWHCRFFFTMYVSLNKSSCIL